MRRLSPLFLLLAAAAPSAGSQPALQPAPRVLNTLAVPAAPVYEPAPLPDPDAAVPTGLIGPAKPHFGPSMFSASKTQFQGDGYVANSTVQVEQEKHYRPGGGFSLKMPLQ